MDRTELINSDTEDLDLPPNPQKGLWLRYFALFFMCFLGFGPYFCYDTPGALQDVMTKELSLTTTEFSYLYSSYSWPNVILCFIGGFLIDRVFGIRTGTLLYTIIVVIGQLIFALGALLNMFWLMIVGRIVFGIGGESLAVAQNYYAVLWFKGKELNMVFGLQLSFARIGSAANFYVMGPLYNFISKTWNGYEAVGILLFLASTTCLISLVCATCLALLDRKAKSNADPAPGKEEEVAKLSDVKDFSPAFWLVCVICICYYVAIFPFIALGKVFFIRKYGLSADDANFVNSLIYLISAFASPALGLLVDKTGRNIFYVTIATIATIISHMILAFTFVNPLIPMISLGIAYSTLASALWPMIALVIPEHQLGSAYGVAQALQNSGLAVTTFLAGMVIDAGGYLMLELFFVSFLSVTLIAALVLWIYDIRTNGDLNMSTAQRELNERNKITADMIQREALLASTAESSENDSSHPQSDFNIRNRYLSRIGANLPVHLAPTNRGRQYRTLR